MQMLAAIAIALYLAKIYGAEVGTRFYSMGGWYGEYFYGAPSVFMLAFPVALLAINRIIWPIMREAGNHIGGAGMGRMLALTRKVYEQPSIAYGDIEETIENGYLLKYQGLVNEKLQYQDQASRSAWLRCDFWIERNTLAMPPRERLFARVLLALKNYGLSDKERDYLTFAMAWGDGRCRVGGGTIKANALMLSQYNIRDHRSLVSFIAGQRDVTTEGAITELSTRLMEAAQQPDPPEEIINLLDALRSLRPGN